MDHLFIIRSNLTLKCINKKVLINLIQNKIEKIKVFIEKSKIIIENVDEKEVNTLLLVFERKDRSGGEKVIDNDYDHRNKVLTITYENEAVVKSVVNFGEIFVKNKKFRAKTIDESIIKGNLCKQGLNKNFN